MTNFSFWSYLKLGKGRHATFTCTFSEDELQYSDLRHLGLQLCCDVEVIAATRLGSEAFIALATACGFLHADQLCDNDLGFHFGLYATDVLNLTKQPDNAHEVIAQTIAAATIVYASLRSHLSPTVLPTTLYLPQNGS